jgi:hypothetical protein
MDQEHFSPLNKWWKIGHYWFQIIILSQWSLNRLNHQVHDLKFPSIGWRNPVHVSVRRVLCEYHKFWKESDHRIVLSNNVTMIVILKLLVEPRDFEFDARGNLSLVRGYSASVDDPRVTNFAHPRYFRTGMYSQTL